MADDDSMTSHSENYSSEYEYMEMMIGYAMYYTQFKGNFKISLNKIYRCKGRSFLKVRAMKLEVMRESMLVKHLLHSLLYITLSKYSLDNIRLFIDQCQKCMRELSTSKGLNLVIFNSSSITFQRYP